MTKEVKRSYISVWVQGRLSTLIETTSFEKKKMLEQLGYEPVGMLESVEEAIVWCKAHSELEPKIWGFQSYLEYGKILNYCICQPIEMLNQLYIDGNLVFGETAVDLVSRDAIISKS